MQKRPPGPSTAWLDAVFNSPPRRDIQRQSKTTTRWPHYSECTGSWMYGEGANEYTAILLLEYLWRLGIVRRFKPQPFVLSEVGGPEKRVPDLLVEMADAIHSLYVIQIKAKRFVSADVQETFDQERVLLEPLGFNYLVWTDRDALGSPTSHTVRHIDAGYRFKPPVSVMNAISIEEKKGSRVLGELLDEFGWDDVISAIAQLKIFINITKEINENTNLLPSFPAHEYRRLFARGNADADWFKSLHSAQIHD